MKKLLTSIACVTLLALTGAAQADNTSARNTSARADKPLELTASQMDGVTAGGWAINFQSDTAQASSYGFGFVLIGFATASAFGSVYAEVVE